jgi:hypothetical protein
VLDLTDIASKLVTVHKLVTVQTHSRLTVMIRLLMQYEIYKINVATSLSPY